MNVNVPLILRVNMSSAIEGKDGKLVTTGGVTVVAAAAAAAEQQLPTALLRGTDMQCGVVGFGCASLGGVYGPADVTTCREAVAEALALGVNFFDTSPYYGDAEAMLGACLIGVARETFYVATKCGRYGDGTHDGDIDFSAERVRASVLRSCELIGVECLDLVQVGERESYSTLVTTRFQLTRVPL